MPASAAGGIPYEHCLHPDAQRAGTEVTHAESFTPCQEGGSVFFSQQHHQFATRKKVIVFYTPPGIRGPAILGSAASRSTVEVNIWVAFARVKARCAMFMRTRPINLGHYLICMQSNLEVQRPAGYSNFRGIAAVFEAPPDDSTGYSRPGYASPPGHVVLDSIDVGEMQRNAVLRGLYVWTFANAPIVTRREVLSPM